ncbi:MAG: arsenite methyltransferase [Phycisphaeraceae bacterium]
MNTNHEPCCGPSCCDGKSEKQEKSAAVTRAVRETYAATARSGLTNDSAGVRDIARAFGYSEAELTSIPAEANMGLSCGNPTALANLKPGEVVVDLGSGGGLDVFIAAQKVGPTGMAIGIDMTQEMIDRARRAARRGPGPGGKPYDNVEFHLSTIDRIPLPDASVDVIVSNCVINLATDKDAVFREMFRVLKPGGRVAVSDIALKQPLPQELADSLMAYVGCIAGAIEIEDYERGLRDSGFIEVAVIDAKADLNAYSQVDGQAACCSPPKVEVKRAGAGVSLSVASAKPCCGPASLPDADPNVHDHLRELISRHDVNEYAASVKVFAVKAK